jgi:hypothetical protein
MSLIFRMAGFDPDAFSTYVEASPAQWAGVHGLWDLVREATLAGDLDLPREDVLLFAMPRPEEVTVNSTRVGGVRGTDVWDLTRAESESRRQARQVAAFLQRYVPGFRRAYLSQTGAMVGVRETRRVVGAYVLTADDVLTARKFPDVIAHGSYPIDIHDPFGRGTVLRRLPPGEAYDIPLRCLIPKDLDDVLVAGRCISATHEALSSCRVIPISMATGQAAGVCAALAARHGLPPARIEARDVQEGLRRQGAILLRDGA